MELKNLVPIVLLLLFTGMLLGVGILTLDKFAKATMTDTTAIQTGINLTGITGQSVVTLSNTYCRSIASIDNGSTTFALATYNVTLATPDTCYATTTNLPCSLPKCNVTYVYGASSQASTSVFATMGAISPIATTWLSLIVTVTILSIILGLVISSFAAGNRG